MVGEVLLTLSKYAIPAVFLVILSSGICKDIKVYDAFLEGAREGFTTVVKIIPALVGMLAAIGVFRASGAMEALVYFLKPLAGLLGIPHEALPLALLRPVSGSASLALVSDYISTYGADSFTGRLISTMMGSTETIFYTLTIYFGSAGIKKTRHVLPAALMADLAGILAAVWMCRLVFG